MPNKTSSPASPSAKPRSTGTWTGGGFPGGGGATAQGWETREEQRQREARAAQQRAAHDLARTKPAPVKASAQSGPERLHSSTKNGYRYDYDRSARTRAVDADLVLAPGWRSRKNQAKAGGADRRPTDHGGHYIAVRLNGSHSKLNHFAQDANFNMGAYRTLEDKWASALQEGKKVHVRIVPFYRGASKRPYRLHVDWYVNGRHREQDFDNEKGGKNNGR